MLANHHYVLYHQIFVILRRLSWNKTFFSKRRSLWVVNWFTKQTDFGILKSSKILLSWSSLSTEILPKPPIWRSNITFERQYFFLLFHTNVAHIYLQRFSIPIDLLMVGGGCNLSLATCLSNFQLISNTCMFPTQQRNFQTLLITLTFWKASWVFPLCLLL